jgi:DnaJ-class molecular chaperone with C-terminal Zn finger domain
MKNYYQILEVEPDASQDKIKEQYLFLIQAWHPDKFPNPAQKTKAEEKTKDINAAYEVLRNSVKRAKYDSSTRSYMPHPEREYRRQEDARITRQKENPLRKERAGEERATAGRSGVSVFINGQERILSVDDLVKASVQYFDGETKEDMGFDYLRTHAAVRAAASRCLKCGVEIHVRKLAA